MTKQGDLFGVDRKIGDINHLTKTLITGGMDDEEIYQVIDIINEKKECGLSKQEIFEVIQAHSKKRTGGLAEEVRKFVLSTDGLQICLQDIYTCLQVSTRDDKKNVSIILKRLSEQGLIEKTGDKFGKYRVVSQDSGDMNWKDVDDSVLDVCFPLNFEQIVETIPKSLTVIAGKSNSGKTAFLLNFAWLNSNAYADRIWYFSSELNEPRLKKRLKLFGYPLKDWDHVHFRPPGHFYLDHLRPDDINIIDYLEIYKDFYEIGGKLNDIFRKLNKGIALIAIQKNMDTDYGLGGQRGIEKADLYIAMDGGRVRIIKGKNWVNDYQNPDGMSLDFKIVKGSKFIMTGEWNGKPKKYQEKEEN